MRSQKAQPAGPERNRRCTATCADGTPCRAWAIRGTDPPLCAAHGGTDARIGAPPGNTNALKHGYHASRGVPLFRTKKCPKNKPSHRSTGCLGLTLKDPQVDWLGR